MESILSHVRTRHNVYVEEKSVRFYSVDRAVVGIGSVAWVLLAVSEAGGTTTSGSPSTSPRELRQESRHVNLASLRCGIGGLLSKSSSIGSSRSPRPLTEFTYVD